MSRDYSPGERWEELRALQAEYVEFEMFLTDVIEGLLGFTCSEQQLDIAAFVASGPKLRMVQAQRGQAKTTITAAYAVWRLIHNPTLRVLIISAGGDFAAEVANWVIQIINSMSLLECMRPDRAYGDRASVKAFDVHYELKGAEKSPSIACIGITASMQGRRADLLIADDIESQKNSQTENQRERLRHLTKDFTSICTRGEIIYLGTPQSIDSIYNGLVSRGYTIRIWPGRFPTEEQEKNYGGCLAPYVMNRMMLDPSIRDGAGLIGLDGQATDPVLVNEDELCKKELDQGRGYFNLQYMLDTRLMDADRFPLKTENLIFMKIPPVSVPLEILHLKEERLMLPLPADWPVQEQYYRAAGFGQEFAPFEVCGMYVDPAGGGQNGDETAYAVVKFLAGRVFLVDFGAVPGGIRQDAFEQLTKVAVKWKPTTIHVEENFGKGSFRRVWEPQLMKEHKCLVEDVWESGQKEIRIVKTLEPVVGASLLVVEEALIAKDWNSVQEYPAEKRSSYSFFYQFARLTRDKGALMHDDRLDAVAGAVRIFSDMLRKDALKSVQRSRADAYKKMMQDPVGAGRPVPGWDGMTLAKGRRLGHAVTPMNTGVRRMRRRYI